MVSLLDTLFSRLTASRQPDRPRLRGRAYACRCGRPVFFRNSKCLACGAELGYETGQGEVRALQPSAVEGLWHLDGIDDPAQAYRRCANLDTPAGCNWLVEAADPQPLCRSCRLNRTIPDLADADNPRYWRAIENAKRRLVSQLLGLGLPVASDLRTEPAAPRPGS